MLRAFFSVLILAVVAGSFRDGLIGDSVSGSAGCRLQVDDGNGKKLKFDFSSISEIGDVSVEFLNDVRLTMHLCRNTTLVGLPTCTDSPICAHIHFANRTSIVDAGSSIKEKTFDDSKLAVKFEGKDQCESSETPKNYTTVIVFECNEIEKQPDVLSSDGCEFLLHWRGLAGCPVQESIVRDNCILAQSGRSFDLRPLQRSSHYRVNHAGIIYLVNFCKPISDSGSGMEGDCPSGVAAICELSNPEKSFVGSKYLSKGSVLKYSLTRGLVMEHPKAKGGKKSGGKAVIIFKCSESLTEPEIKFISEDRNNLKFMVESSVTCIPPVSQCQAKLAGYDFGYDLRPLYKQAENWEVTVPSGKYYFNVCGGLNSVEGLTCSGGAISACWFDERTNRIISLGSHYNISIPPVKARINDHRIVLTYKEGSFCDSVAINNTTVQPRLGRRRHSLVVRLVCSRFNTQPPQFDSYRRDDCTHNFLWHTTAACPLKYSKGDNCRMEPGQDVERSFNFEMLRHPSEDYTIETEDSTFRMNLCGPLVHPCNGEQQASVCLINKDTGQELVVGRGPLSTPEFSDGKITFTSDQPGDPCHKSARLSSVTMIMTCNYDDVNSSPQYISRDDNCHYYFVWSTADACGSRTQSSCSVTTRSDHLKLTYDLSPLTIKSENYIVSVGDGMRSTIFLNVCHSVVPTHFVLCEPNSAACLVDTAASDPGKRAINIGSIEMEDSPTVEGEKLILRYRNGVVCYNGPSGSLTTLIEFKCDPHAHLTAPKLISFKDCIYRMEWTASAACPIRKTVVRDNNTEVILPPSPPSSPSSTSTTYTVATSQETISLCSVRSPITNKTIDLKSLMGRVFTAVDNPRLRVSVCSALNESPCPHTFRSGACLETSSGFVHLGTANADLHYARNGDDPSVYLNYTTEAGCGMVINFACWPGEERVFSDDSPTEGCNMFVTLETPLVCEYELAKYCCRGEDGALCSKFEGDHAVKVVTGDDSATNSIVWLSVCRSLTGGAVANCLRGASACLVEKGSNKSQTLGFPFARPEILGGGSIRLVYTDGDVCLAGAGSRKFSSSIVFHCNRNGGKGVPTFVSSDGCEFNFEWRTELICSDLGDASGDEPPRDVDELTAACTKAIDASLPFKLLFTNLSNELDDIKVASEKSRTEYQLRLCSVSPTKRVTHAHDESCRGAGMLCSRDRDSDSLDDDGWRPFAWFKDVTTAGSVTTLHHHIVSEKGENCTADVRLLCDPAISHGSLVIISESECELVMELKTSAACPSRERVLEPIAAAKQPHPPQDRERPQESSSGGYGVVLISVFSLVFAGVLFALGVFLVRRKFVRNNYSSQFRYSREQDEHTEI